VDPRGQVFFQDNASGAIWKIDAQGKLTKYHDTVSGHWMALDVDGHFARAERILDLRRITPADVKPALIVADGGAPITVNRDGNLYFGLALLGGAKIAPGVTRVSPDGTQTLFAPGLNRAVEKLGITGLAAGPDGSLYVACPSAVLKVKMDGTFETLVQPVVVADCDEDLPDNNLSPYLRGLDVDSRGTVYAAATGCRRVVKITPDGKVGVVLKSERPWSPTGVAVRGEDVYVLEYTNANGGPDEGWWPRVRKLGRDGKVTTLVTVPREGGPGRPR
jgi:sugar lactone lactonase YvrE